MRHPENRDPAFDATTIGRHYGSGDWDANTITDYVRRNAAADPHGTAFHAPDIRLTWSAYDRLATQLAGAFVQLGMERGALVGTLLSGGSLVHVTYLAAQRAGLSMLGMGPRSGDQEVARLVQRTACPWLITRVTHRGRPTADLVAAVAEHGAHVEHHVAVDLDDEGLRLTLDGVAQPIPDVEEAGALIDGRGLGADELFFLSSTSGTTGVSKCVTSTMNTRKYFAPLAADAAELTDDDVFCSVLPSPYGFGLWSAHIVPTRYRLPTVLCADFDAAETLRLIERHRVTVLAAVTSQFVMMLNSPAVDECDLSSLRVVFTGGEPLKADRARQFEERFGATILQFYGSNEAGPVSVTRIGDSLDKRLHTVGKPVPAQRVRLFDAAGNDVTVHGGSGQCAALGPGTTPGYYRDAAADDALFADDGWLLTGDLATVDDEGYLVISGRTSDVIIRGGQNISAIEVEAEVATHPRIAQVAAVGVPDPVLGERVCVVVSTTDGSDIDLESVCEHLCQRGVSKHWWPERLRQLPELPLGVGGKLDKQGLRDEVVSRSG